MRTDVTMAEDCSYLLDEAAWNQVLSSLDEGVHVVDEHGRTLLYNDTASSLDGLEPEEVVGRNIFTVFPSLTLENSTLMRTVQSGEPLENVLQSFINRRGEEITTVNSTVPLELSDGSRGALEISRDITLLQELVDDVSNLRRCLGEHRVRSGAVPGSDQAEERIENNTSYTFSDLKGRDEKFRAVIEEAIRAASSDSTVMIRGETGTGKELVAQGIHNASPRSDSPFIAQNCAALPRDLLEGLLFGTEEGGFTGARSRPGLFEQACGGTILLDEIDALDYDLQAKLLRVVQESRVRRIGSQEEKKVDVRILATMNSEPEQAFAEERLREDLYYRLAVVSLKLPPLRRRRDDIPLLIDHFVNTFNAEFDRRLAGFSPGLRERLKNHHWPGNVRELKHFVEACFNLCRGEKGITWQNLPHQLREKLEQDEEEMPAWREQIDRDELPPLQEFLAGIERDLIAEALSREEGNISAAARELEISRQSLQYKLDKYDLR